jgi:hypothetical protein
MSAASLRVSTLAIGYAEKPLPPPPELPQQSLFYQEKSGEAFSTKSDSAE